MPLCIFRHPWRPQAERLVACELVQVHVHRIRLVQYQVKGSMYHINNIEFCIHYLIKPGCRMHSIMANLNPY